MSEALGPIPRTACPYPKKERKLIQLFNNYKYLLFGFVLVDLLVVVCLFVF